MANSTTYQYIFKGDAAGLKSSLSSIQGQAQKVTGQIGKMSAKLKSVGQKMTSIGRNMTVGFTAPLALIGTQSVRTAAKFNESMNKVSAITGATGKTLENMSKISRELGATTVFTASQSAEALTFLGMAGLSAEESMKALPETLNLAAAASVDLGTAADIATNIMSGYGMQVDDLNRINDVMAKTTSSANTNMIEMAEAMKLAGPVASGVGLDFEEVSAAVGQLANAGFKGSLAGTALRGAMVRLLNPTNQITEALEKNNIQTKNSDGSLLSLTEIIKNLEDQSVSTADMMAIFGQRAGPAMLALVSQGSAGIEELQEKLENSEGTAKRMADTQMGGLSGALKTMRSAIESLAITFGDILAPVITRASELLQNLAKWFQNLSPTMKRTIAIVTGIVAAIGPLILTLGIAAKAAAFMIPIVTGLGASIGALLGPIGIAIGAVLLLRKAYNDNLFGIRDAFGDLWDTIKSVGSSIIESFGLLWESIMNVAGIFNVMTENGENAGKSFISLSKIIEGISLTFSAFFEFLGIGVSVISNVVKVASDGFLKLAAVARGSIEGMRSGFSGLGDSIKNSIYQGLANAEGFILNFVKGAAEKFNKLGDVLGISIDTSGLESRLFNLNEFDQQLKQDAKSAGAAFRESFQEGFTSVEGIEDILGKKSGTDALLNIDETVRGATSRLKDKFFKFADLGPIASVGTPNTASQIEEQTQDSPFASLQSGIAQLGGIQTQGISPTSGLVAPSTGGPSLASQPTTGGSGGGDTVNNTTNNMDYTINLTFKNNSFLDDKQSKKVSQQMERQLVRVLRDSARRGVSLSQT